MGLFSSSTLKKAGLLFAVKKVMRKNKNVTPEIASVATEVATDVAKGFAFILKLKIAVALMVIGLVTFMFSNINGFFICLLALLILINLQVAIEFLVLGVITICLYHSFHSLPLAVSITLPVWLLYNVFHAFIKPKPPKEAKAENIETQTELQNQETTAEVKEP